MNKKLSLTACCTALGVLFSVYFSNFQKDSLSTVVDNVDKCQFSNNVCLIYDGDEVFRLVFAQKPIVEEELVLNYALPSGWELSTSWVEGVNMYMGKSLIIDYESSDRNQVKIFLGSCSEPKMQWKIVLNLKNKNANESKRLFAFFKTDVNES